MMKALPYEYYGDNFRWFIATVIDVSPPYGYEGRVQIRIHGLHSSSTKDIPQGDLPWAQCILPTTEGGVSGIGRNPNLQPSALVMGFFADGENSQTPIVVGSIPHIEFPTILQTEQALEDIGDENKPNGVFEQITSLFKPKDVDVEDTNNGNINNLVKLSREKGCVQFFINIGYTVKQAIAISASLSIASGMRTKPTVQARGLADWGRDRFGKLQEFSTNNLNFYTQLIFIAYELRGEKTNANIKLLQTDTIEGKNGAVRTFIKYYMDTTDETRMKQSELAARRMMDRIG